MAQKRQRLVTVITGYEPRRDDQVWPPITCDIAPPHAQLQATWLGDRMGPRPATARYQAAPRDGAAAMSPVDVGWPYVELDAGVVRDSSEPGCVGQFRFFVSFIDRVGERLAFWDGSTHADALAIASRSACDFTAPEFDRSRRRRR